MRVAVIASGTFLDYEFLKETLERIFITKIISRGNAGADELAEKYADEKNIPLCIVPGEEHNDYIDLRQIHFIVNQAQLIIAFWDGKAQGTCDLVKYAQQKKKPVKVYNYRAKEQVTKAA